MGEASHNEKRPTCLEGSMRYPLDLTALDKTYRILKGPFISVSSPINL